MFISLRVLFVFSFLACLFAGCQSGSKKSAPRESMNGQIVSEIQSKKVMLTTQTVSNNGQKKTEKRQGPRKQVKTPSFAFTPPYADRTDMFSPPTRKAFQKQGPTDDGFEAITLQGFANVHGLKAVLLVNGVIAPLSVGEKLKDLQVIAIEPPKVVLQRGRERWTTSMDR